MSSSTGKPDPFLENIADLPSHTAPYPPDSVPGEENNAKRLEVEDARVWPMVMSVGWNPYFKNEKITAVRRALLDVRGGRADGVGGAYYTSLCA